MKPFPYGILCLELPSLELPPDPTDFSGTFEVEFGEFYDAEASFPRGGTDVFKLNVCTLARLQASVKEAGFFVDPCVLVLERFSWEALRGHLETLCESIEGDDWGAVQWALERCLGKP